MTRICFTGTKAMADYFEAILKTGKPEDLPLTNRLNWPVIGCWENSPGTECR